LGTHSKNLQGPLNRSPCCQLSLHDLFTAPQLKHLSLRLAHVTLLPRHFFSKVVLCFVQNNSQRWWRVLISSTASSLPSPSGHQPQRPGFILCPSKLLTHGCGCLLGLKVPLQTSFYIAQVSSLGGLTFLKSDNLSLTTGVLTLLTPSCCFS
jgi:hypothetical protein